MLIFFCFPVILGKSHYVLFNLVSAMQPRMLVTFDTDLRPLPVSVRVGQVSGMVKRNNKDYLALVIQVLFLFAVVLCCQ